MVSRRKWLGGNWKCNGTKQSISDLLLHFNRHQTKNNNLDVVLFPPSLYVDHTRNELKSEVFELGVQNVSQSKSGAYTGELSLTMFADFGLKWSLVGHSERRQLFKEDDSYVCEKVMMLQENGVNAVVCFGETLSEREQGQTENVLKRQLDAFVKHVKDWDKVVLAYEPVWAIGTGKVATVEQVKEAHKFVRDYVRGLVGDVADKVRLVYGGSVNEKNCLELSKCSDVDGFLVGGASLKKEFLDILKSLE
uniref:Triosephosphate isomerase n=1 Tax=Theileria annulata TaxID=5874 RepID=A0A3B0NJ17_THEAN